MNTKYRKRTRCNNLVAFNISRTTTVFERINDKVKVPKANRRKTQLVTVSKAGKQFLWSCLPFCLQLCKLFYYSPLKRHFLSFYRMIMFGGGIWFILLV